MDKLTLTHTTLQTNQLTDRPPDQHTHTPNTNNGHGYTPARPPHPTNTRPPARTHTHTSPQTQHTTCPRTPQPPGLPTQGLGAGTLRRYTGLMGMAGPSQSHTPYWRHEAPALSVFTHGSMCCTPHCLLNSRFSLGVFYQVPAQSV